MIFCANRFSSSTSSGFSAARIPSSTRTRFHVARNTPSGALFQQRTTRIFSSRSPPENQFDNSQPTSNEFLNHPAILQQEALRQFYRCGTAEGQLQIVENSAEYLDATTALHLCVSVAELCFRGRLPGEVRAHDLLLRTLYTNCIPSLEELSSQDLGQLLWSFACMPSILPELSSYSAASSSSSSLSWKALVIEQVAIQEGNRKDSGMLLIGSTTRVKKYNSKELVNILFAVGLLCSVSPRPSPPVTAYVLELLAELERRIETMPYVKGSFSAGDYTDLAAVCARVFSSTTDNSTTASSSSISLGVVPNEVIKFLDAIASEVRRQLTNNHSRAAFLPKDLGRFLNAYASLGIQTPAVVGMFDVVSGFVVSRIMKNDLNAVTRPEDIAAVLAAYARQQHRSVAVPELLTAAGEQMKRNAVHMQDQCMAASARAREYAAMVEEERKKNTAGSSGNNKNRAQLRGGSSSNSTISSGGDGDVPYLGCFNSTLVSILESHRMLGYSPDVLTLTAVLPAVHRGLARSNAQEVQQLLDLFDVFQFYPGMRLAELMQARVAVGTAAEEEYMGK